MKMASTTSDTFHSGEYRIQHRLGIAERIDEQMKGFIRPYMPEQHRIFLY